MSNRIAKRQRKKHSSTSTLQSRSSSEITTIKWQDSPEGLSPDWAFSSNSNVHVCNDRKWFTELTDFSSIASSEFIDQKLPVAGVGAVNLPLKRSPDLRGPDAHHVLRLTDVLYMPSSPCNIVGSPIFGVAPHFSFGRTEKSMGSISNANGKPIAYFSPGNKRLCFRLSGPPVGPRLGPSKFESDTAYLLTIEWPDNTEKRQWIGDQPYTPEENQWLKKHYGGEFKFLMTYGLKISNEEDQAEGRAIMRALARDNDSNNDNDEDDDEIEMIDEEEEEEKEEEDLKGHLANYHFNAEELDWIEKHYGNSANFMVSYGFKFYDDQDCAAARGLVKDFLRE